MTDSSPLPYLVSSAKLSATDHRWLSGLASFDFTATCWARKAHSDTRGLSGVLYTLSSGAGTVLDEDCQALSGQAVSIGGAQCLFMQGLSGYLSVPPGAGAIQSAYCLTQTADSHGLHSLWRLRNQPSSGLSSLRLKDPFVGHVLSILHRTQSLDQLRSDNSVCLDV